MSINTLLSNPFIMNQLVDAIDAQSGNVASVSGQAPIVVSPTAGNCVVSLPIGGTFIAGVSDVVKGSSSSSLVWGSDASGGVYTGVAPITVVGTSISVTDGAYLLATGGALTLDITGSAGTTGQVLAKSATTGSLEWVDNTAGSVYTGTAPIDVSGTVISVSKGAYITSSGGALTLDISGSAPTTGQVLAKSSATGTLEWVDNTAGSVYTGVAPITVVGTSISLTDGAYLLATGGALTLDTTGSGIQGQVLAQSATTGKLDWVDNIANLGLGINQSYSNPVITFPWQNTSTTTPVSLSMTLTTTIASVSYFVCGPTAGTTQRASGNYSAQIGSLPATIIVPPLYYVNIVGNPTFSDTYLLS